MGDTTTISCDLCHRQAGAKVTKAGNPRILKRMNNRKRRARRERMWASSPNCAWCDRRTNLAHLNNGSPRELDATVDHLISRSSGSFVPGRQRAVVIACARCNAMRNSLERLLGMIRDGLPADQITTQIRHALNSSRMSAMLRESAATKKVRWHPHSLLCRAMELVEDEHCKAEISELITRSVGPREARTLQSSAR
jgi:5-methylcytosine-specific restriction endonuclease McrA